MKTKVAATNSFSSFLDARTIKLLSAKGNDLVQEIGMDVVRGVVLNVLSGRNLRDSTEALTRRRIASLNLATMNLFLRGTAADKDFVANLPHAATRILKGKGLLKAEKWIAEWMLGLNDKAVQNVLRDNPNHLDRYAETYIRICQEAITSHAKTYGQLSGELSLDDSTKAKVNWLFITYLLNTIGAQTLAIRGSEKSSYGKLFEKLILGSLLHILGFKFISPPAEEFKKVFWLSSRNEKRESDATLLFEAGKGVRFDIGFIGRGNPEISLDKVSRFEREITLGKSKWFMATIILVDRIGENSRIERLAKEIKGSIIQMSASYWPQQVAKELHEAVGLDHELVKMDQARIGRYLESELKKVPLEKFIGMGLVDDVEEEE